MGVGGQVAQGELPAFRGLHLEGAGGPHLSFLLMPLGGSTSSLSTISNPRQSTPTQFYASSPMSLGQFQWLDRGGRSRLTALISG